LKPCFSSHFQGHLKNGDHLRFLAFSVSSLCSLEKENEALGDWRDCIRSPVGQSGYVINEEGQKAVLRSSLATELESVLMLVYILQVLCIEARAVQLSSVAAETKADYPGLVPGKRTNRACWSPVRTGRSASSRQI